MPFKYINPGYAELLADSSMTTSKSTTYNPINGIAMKGSGDGYYYLPEGCDEVWVKFGFYSNTTYTWQLNCYIGSNQSKYGFYRYGKDDNRAYFQGVSTKIQGTTDYDCHTVWMHCKAGSDGLLEIFIDGVEAFSKTGEVTWANQYVYFKSANTSLFITNIIISDHEIAKSEEVYVLTPKTTETDMGESGGLYTADSENQHVRQKVDVAALKSKAGSDAVSITGLAVAAVPAYYEGDGLSSLAAMKNDAEMETVALSSNIKAGIVVSWSEAMSADALSNLTLGWKAKS
ncbi:MAG: hypothetical protein IJ741_05540 [Schwartzia sp.]|nr:hypothetical protein [Schwartzia sp. (in: firmicutes)]